MAPLTHLVQKTTTFLKIPQWGQPEASRHPKRTEAPRLGEAALSADHLMPPSIQRSNAKHWNDNVITEVKQFEGPHLLPAAPGWEQVADYALDWALEHAALSSRRSEASSSLTSACRPS